MDKKKVDKFGKTPKSTNKSTNSNKRKKVKKHKLFWTLFLVTLLTITGLTSFLVLYFENKNNSNVVQDQASNTNEDETLLMSQALEALEDDPTALANALVDKDALSGTVTVDQVVEELNKLTNITGLTAGDVTLTPGDGSLTVVVTYDKETYTIVLSGFQTDAEHEAALMKQALADLANDPIALANALVDKDALSGTVTVDQVVEELNKLTNITGLTAGDVTLTPGDGSLTVVVTYDKETYTIVLSGFQTEAEHEAALMKQALADLANDPIALANALVDKDALSGTVTVDQVVEELNKLTNITGLTAGDVTLTPGDGSLTVVVTYDKETYTIVLSGFQTDAEHEAALMKQALADLANDPTALANALVDKDALSGTVTVDQVVEELNKLTNITGLTAGDVTLTPGDGSLTVVVTYDKETYTIVLSGFQTDAEHEAALMKQALADLANDPTALANALVDKDALSGTVTVDQVVEELNKLTNITGLTAGDVTLTPGDGSLTVVVTYDKETYTIVLSGFQTDAEHEAALMKQALADLANDPTALANALVDKDALSGTVTVDQVVEELNKLTNITGLTAGDVTLTPGDGSLTVVVTYDKETYTIVLSGFQTDAEHEAALMKQALADLANDPTALANALVDKDALSGTVTVDQVVEELNKLTNITGLTAGDVTLTPGDGSLTVVVTYDKETYTIVLSGFQTDAEHEAALMKQALADLANDPTALANALVDKDALSGTVTVDQVVEELNKLTNITGLTAGDVTLTPGDGSLTVVVTYDKETYTIVLSGFQTDAEHEAALMKQALADLANDPTALANALVDKDALSGTVTVDQVVEELNKLTNITGLTAGDVTLTPGDGSLTVVVTYDKETYTIVLSGFQTDAEHEAALMKQALADLANDPTALANALVDKDALSGTVTVDQVVEELNKLTNITGLTAGDVTLTPGDGSLTVVVTYDKETYTIVLSGFQTDAEHEAALMKQALADLANDPTALANALVDKDALSGTVTVDQVVEELNKLTNITGLTAGDVTLTPGDGSLTVVVTYDKETYTIVLSGFQTDAEHEAALMKQALADLANDPTALANALVDKDALSGTVTVDQVVEELNKLTNITGLTAGDVTLTPGDGSLTVVVTYDKETYTIVLSGFQTDAEHEAALMKQALADLANDPTALANALVDKDALSGTVTVDQVVEELNKLTNITGLTAGDVTLTPGDGSLTVVVTYDKETYTIVLSGFQTDAEHEAALMKQALADLANDPIALANALVDKDALSGTVTVDQVVEELNKLTNITGLTAGDVTLTPGDGSLTVVVTYDKETYTIVLSGFQTDAEHEAALMKQALADLANDPIALANALVDKDALSGTVTVDQVVEELNKLTNITGLTAGDVTLTPGDGSLTVVVTYDKETYTIVLSGFQTDAEHEAALMKQALADLANDPIALANALVDKDALSGTVTVDQVVEELNKLTNITGLTAGDVTLTPGDGSLTVVVTYDKETYTIVLSGFQTDAEHEAALMKQALADLANDPIALANALVDKDALSGTVTVDQVVEELNKLTNITGLTAGDVTLTPGDGSLTVVVTYDKETYTIVLSGFQTDAEHEAALMKQALADLANDPIALANALVDKDALSGTVTVDQVVEELNKLTNITGLTAGDVTLTPGDGSLTVVVTYDKETYTIVLSGFQTDAEHEAALMKQALADLANDPIALANALVDKDALSGTVTVDQVVEELNKLTNITGLTAGDVTLTPGDGSLTVVVTYDKETYTIVLSGFQTDAEHEAALMKQALADLANDPTALANALVDKDALSGTVTVDQVVEELNKLTNITGLTAGDVTLTPGDGSLTVVVTYDKETYTIVLSGFQTDAEHEAALMKQALADLANDPTALANALVDKDALSGTVTVDQVVEELNKLTNITGLTAGDVTLTPGDGSLTVVVTYDKETYTIVLSGFQTDTEHQEEVAKQVEQELENEIVDPGIYGTFVNEDEVLRIIQSYDDTVTKADLVFAGDDAMGTLTITILNYYGEDNDLIITLVDFQKYDQSDTIPANAYEGKTLPAWFTVPETVTTIGDYAFAYATFLGEFTLANTQVETIGYKAFNSVELPAGFALPDSLRTICDSAFANSTFLGYFSLPDSVTTIGEWTFNNITLPDGWGLNIPDALTSLGEAAFKDATIAAGERVPDGIETIPDQAFEGATFLGDFAIYSEVTKIGNSAFKGATFNENVTIAGGVAQISEGAFKGASFYGDVVIMDGVTEIGYAAFKNASFYGDVMLPDTVTKFGEEAFYGANFDGYFLIPDSVTEIGKAAFNYAVLPAGFVIPDTVTTLGDYAFSQATLADGSGLNIPDGLTHMGEYAFRNTTIAAGESIPDGIVAIPNNAFLEATFLGDFAIHSEVTEIGDSAFKDATFNGSFAIPSTTSIRDNAFKDVQMADNLTWFDENGVNQGQDATPKPGWYIGELTEIEKKLYSEIVDPSIYGTFVDEDEVLRIIQSYVDSVTKADLVFAGDDAMGTLTITILNYYGEGNDLIITLIGFQKYDQSDTIPASAYEDETLPAWFTVPETVTIIGDNAFFSATFLGDFTLVDTQVETIGEGAFISTELPAGFALPNSLITIGENAFYEATFLGNFTLANTQVETIGEGAFFRVTLPAGFALPDSLITIGDYAFYKAIFLGEFVIPENVSVGQDAFKDVQMADNLTWFDENGVNQGQDATPKPGWYIGELTEIEKELYSEIVDPSIYGTFVNEDEVLRIIQSYVDSVTKADLVFAGDDAMGTLTITILNYYGEGNDLIITLIGFQKYDQSDTIPEKAYESEILPAWFTVPETVTTIGDYAFAYVTFKGYFTLANTQVETIGVGVFEGVTLPDEFALPNSLITIGDYAFANATFLGDFTLVDTQVETIGRNTFYKTEFFGDVVLPDSLTSIEDYAFMYATFNGDFTLANTQVETIGEGVFEGVTLPTGFALPDSVTSIGDRAFYGATFLGDFTMANTQVETIGRNTFYKTEFFGDVVLPDSLTSIEDYAFIYATFNGDFTLANTQVETIGSYAFGYAILPDGFAIPENVTIGTDAFKDIKMADNLTWFDETGVEQTSNDTPEPGWYIAPMGS